MKDDYTTDSHYDITHLSIKHWENELFELGSERVGLATMVMNAGSRSLFNSVCGKA